MSGTVLITGANRGIGLGLTRQFLARGWQVLATCRQPDRAHELAALGRSHPGRCGIHALDVRDAAGMSALAATWEAGRLSLDVLVNNAGVNPEPRDLGIDRVAASAVAEALDTNVVGALRVLQAAVPALRRSANPRVINLASGAGSLLHNSSTRPQPAYSISKAALNMFTRCAARDLPDLVVVSVSPGRIDTGLGSGGAELGMDEATAALVATIENLQPAQSGQWLDRFGRPSPYAW